MIATPLTWLYVPGDRPDRFDKAAASGADVVILDLEDAVAPARKDEARAAVRDWVASARTGSVEVRVNAAGTQWHAADLAALVDRPALRSVRLPKVESAAEVTAVLDSLPVSMLVSCLLETARGIEAAFEIASAHERVESIALGEADLASDLGASGDAALAWSRSRVVVAARAAGRPPPAMSVYAHVHDLDGLAESCRIGRALGFVGRAAIHPTQLPVIDAAFRPSAAEAADAAALIAAFDDGVAAGRGVVVLPDGRMVDAAMIGHARRIVALAG
ncbi:MAG: citE3 [Pseudonocardiales bacterium]|nr:citE3 [Pseudonocardiales bacterium]